MSGTNILPSGAVFPITVYSRGLANNGFTFDVNVLSSGQTAATNGWNLVNYSGAGTVITVSSGLSLNGNEIKISDWFGHAGTSGQSIVVSGVPAGTVTFNGASTTTISSAYGNVDLYASGDSNYRLV